MCDPSFSKERPRQPHFSAYSYKKTAMVRPAIAAAARCRESRRFEER
jgi:hypothetical protein